MLDLLASFPKIDKFFSILNGIFSDCPGVSTKHIIAICMGMLALNSSTSVRKIYRLFANKVFKSHLNSYYHHLEYAKYDHNLWIAKLTRLALSCINAHNKLPVSLIIDDTIIKKFGQKFEAVSNLYDHSITDSENKYVNGHCFVCIVLAIPVLIKGNINYIRVPVGLKLWLPENVSDEYKTKIDMAYELLNTVKNEIDDNIQLVVVNDTWYSRDKIISFIKDNKNVEAVIAVRLNTVLYNKPTISKCGRGRPALKGKKN